MEFRCVNSEAAHGAMDVKTFENRVLSKESKESKQTPLP
jgi:hypothetical protein